MRERTKWYIVDYHHDNSVWCLCPALQEFHYKIARNLKSIKQNMDTDYQEVISKQDIKLIRAINNRNHPFAKRLHR